MRRNILLRNARKSTSEEEDILSILMRSVMTKLILTDLHYDEKSYSGRLSWVDEKVIV